MMTLVLPDDDEPGEPGERKAVMRQPKIMINALRAKLDAANREGRAVVVNAADIYEWPGGVAAGAAVDTLVPQWVVVIMLEYLEADPSPAMTFEEWVAALCSIPEVDGPYGLWFMLQTTDAKADALAHMAYEFGGKR